MQTSGLIDLSATKPQPIVKKKNTIAEVKEAAIVYRNTMEEAIGLRFGLMQEMSKALASRVQLAPGTPHPADELRQRLQFLDRSIVRFTDLIVACRVVFDHYNDPAFLNRFPGMVEKLPELIDVLVDNRDKQVHETTHEEALLVAGFRDLKRFHDVLVLVP